MKWSGRKIRIAVSLIAVSGVAAFMGNACSQLRASDGANVSGAAVMACEQPTYQTVPGTIAVSIKYGSTILASMQSCLGLSTTDLQTPLADGSTTIQENNSRMASFSQAGYVGDVNSAMMMGIAAVAIDACSDLVTKEAAMTSGRNYFPTVNFSSATMSQSDIDDAATRIARECWQRNPTSEELTTIETGTEAMGSVGAQYQAINVCASVLASLAGVSNPAGVL